MNEISSEWVVNRITELLNQRKWTIYRLAKESGLAYSSLHNLFVRSNSPSIYTLSKICFGLNISVSEFFSEDTPEYTEQSILTADEKKLLSLYDTLNKHDRELLFAYISGLSKENVYTPHD